MRPDSHEKKNNGPSGQRLFNPKVGIGLIGVAMISFVVGWIAYHEYQDRLYSRALDNVEQMGGSFTPDKRPLRVGVYIDFQGTQIRDADLRLLEYAASDVLTLDLSDTTISDEGIDLLLAMDFEILDWIDLRGTRVTPAAIDRLKKSFGKRLRIQSDYAPD